MADRAALAAFSHPNPFNPRVPLEYQLPVRGQVDVRKVTMLK